MGDYKKKIIISAIIGSLLLLEGILHTLKIITNDRGTIILNTLIYLTICYLHTNRISTMNGRILMVVISLCLVTLIISNHFYIGPWGWAFASRLIYGIDTGANVAFMLMVITRDRRYTVLFTTFIMVADLMFFNLADSRPFNVIFTLIISIIVYAMLSIIHIKQLSDRRWTVATVTLTLSAMVVFGILLRIYWSNHQMLFILLASIDCSLCLIPLLWICFPKLKAWWKINRVEEMIEDYQNNFLDMAGLPTRFTIIELCTATENFEAPIGEGGSGIVFKGTLADGSTIAVKRIKWQASGQTEFKTEITIIASLQHVNLVRLVGYCLSPQGDRYLVYPFFENGSLDSWLFKDYTKRSPLTWPLRYHIAIGVAKALAYLHHECHHQILHLDIKPANILLDQNFRALVSDFGISKLMERDESSVMTRARGTVGYLAPEMLVPNAISIKCDIYSYGMVLFELLGGRRNIMLVVDKESPQPQSSYLPKIVRDKMMQGRLMEVVDECLLRNEELREEEVTVLARLALWCIQENPELRPSMTDVVGMLEGYLPVHVPPESSMYVLNFLDMVTQSTIAPPLHRDDKGALLSPNMLSISIQSGR